MKEQPWRPSAATLSGSLSPLRAFSVSSLKLILLYSLCVVCEIHSFIWWDKNPGLPPHLESAFPKLPRGPWSASRFENGWWKGGAAKGHAPCRAQPAEGLGETPGAAGQFSHAGRWASPPGSTYRSQFRCRTPLSFLLHSLFQSLSPPENLFLWSISMNHTRKAVKGQNSQRQERLVNS